MSEEAKKETLYFLLTVLVEGLAASNVTAVIY